MKKAILLLALLCPLSSLAANAPVLFFSDLTNAPNSGGETVSGFSGAYVTLYGNFLGSSPGTSTVTWNGKNCLRVVSGTGSYTGWGMTWLWYQMIKVQLGSGCTAGSGNFVVTVGGQASDGIPFTVNAGSILFVATTGSDSNNGSFSSPWKTIPHAVQTAGTGAGNIIYLENGVSATVDDGQWNGAVSLKHGWCNGTATQMDGLVGYPGAMAQIGPNSVATNGLVSSDFTATGGACEGHWTIAGGIIFRGLNPMGLSGGDVWRIIGNDISDPLTSGSNGGSACFETSQATNARVLGNNFHDMNLASTDRLQQGVYFSTDSNHAELGWNVLNNAKGRATLQIHSSPLVNGTGFAMFDIKIHDNIIHGANEECIIVDTVDPSQGGVSVYNNLVYDCGRDGSGSSLYRAVSSDFDTSHGDGSGNIDWFHNTVYCDGGAECFSSSFEVHTGQSLTDRVRNNLFYSTGASHPYWNIGNSQGGGQCSPSNSVSQCPNFVGSNNLVFGDGPPTFTSILTNSINQNPQFVNLGSDFHLQSSSPAVGAGATGAPIPIGDLDGITRPTPPSIGAYEVAGGVVVNKPNPPTNLTIVVQ
jgi:hypothetical protein